MEEISSGGREEESETPCAQFQDSTEKWRGGGEEGRDGGTEGGRRRTPFGVIEANVVLETEKGEEQGEEHAAQYYCVYSRSPITDEKLARMQRFLFNG